MTPSDDPVAAKLRREAIDERALAGAGRPGDADEIGAARSGKDRAHQIGAGGIFILDEGDGAGHGSRVAREDAAGKRGAHRVSS